MRTILFICSGNTCRSPMAEAVARDWISRGGLDGVSGGDVFVASAGVYASEGTNTSIEAVDALRRIGLEHHGVSKHLTAEMVIRADAVLCMTDDHVQAVRTLMRDADLDSDGDTDADTDGDADHSRPGSTIIERLDPSRDISDPIGQGAAAYDQVLAHLRRIIPDRLKEVLNHEGRSRIRSSR